MVARNPGEDTFFGPGAKPVNVGSNEADVRKRRPTAYTEGIRLVPSSPMNRGTDRNRSCLLRGALGDHFLPTP